MIPVKQQWTSQPPSGTPIDWTNPLTKGLRRLYVPMGDGRLFDLVDGVISTATDPTAWTQDLRTGENSLYSPDTSGATDDFEWSENVMSGGSGTVLFRWAAQHDLGTGAATLADEVGGFSHDSGGNSRVYYRLNTDFYWRTVSTNAYTATPLGKAIPAWTPHNILISAEPNLQHVALDGKIIDNQTLTGGWTNLTTTYFGASPVWTAGTATSILALWDRALDEAESVAVTENAWQLFQPRTVFLPTTDGGADHTLTATNIQSTSNVTSPALTQLHVLTQGGTQSTTQVDSPTLAQLNILTATSIQSLSEVSAPTLSQNSADHALTATSIQSLSETSASVLAQVHALTATSIQSLTSVSSAVLNGAEFLDGTMTEEFFFWRSRKRGRVRR